MWDRLLLAIDQFESGQSALEFAAGVASAHDASVRVLHIRELSRMARVLPLESPGEAEELARERRGLAAIVRCPERRTILFRAARARRPPDRAGGFALGVSGDGPWIPTTSWDLPAVRSRREGAHPQALVAAGARGARDREQRYLLALQVQDEPGASRNRVRCLACACAETAACSLGPSRR